MDEKKNNERFTLELEFVESLANPDYVRRTLYA